MSRMTVRRSGGCRSGRGENDSTLPGLKCDEGTFALSLSRARVRGTKSCQCVPKLIRGCRGLSKTLQCCAKREVPAPATRYPYNLRCRGIFCGAVGHLQWAASPLLPTGGVRDGISLPYRGCAENFQVELVSGSEGRKYDRKALKICKLASEDHKPDIHYLRFRRRMVGICCGWSVTTFPDCQMAIGSPRRRCRSSAFSMAASTPLVTRFLRLRWLFVISYP